jgi:hypothetical protein
MWHEMVFLIIFSIEKCDVVWGDVACYLNFQNYFSMEKGDVAWGDFFEFLELFFNGERWCGILLEFLKIFLMEKDDMVWDDVTYLHVERIKINDL